MTQIGPIDLEKTQNRSRYRSIIIKFTWYNVHNVFFRKKAVSITENLARQRITEMKVARET